MSQTETQEMLDAPTAKEWIALARIHFPGEPLIMPQRFIGPIIAFENELDIDAIKTGAWMRKWGEEMSQPENGWDHFVDQTDPHTIWIQNNMDQLARYPNEWIALDPEHGIIFHASDGDTFDAWIDAKPLEDLALVMIFHSSMYV